MLEPDVSDWDWDEQQSSTNTKSLPPASTSHQPLTISFLTPFSHRQPEVFEKCEEIEYFDVSEYFHGKVFFKALDSGSMGRINPVNRENFVRWYWSQYWSSVNYFSFRFMAVICVFNNWDAVACKKKKGFQMNKKQDHQANIWLMAGHFSKRNRAIVLLQQY